MASVQSNPRFMEFRSSIQEAIVSSFTSSPESIKTTLNNISHDFSIVIKIPKSAPDSSIESKLKALQGPNIPPIFQYTITENSRFWNPEKTVTISIDNYHPPVANTLTAAATPAPVFTPPPPAVAAPQTPPNSPTNAPTTPMTLPQGGAGSGSSTPPAITGTEESKRDPDAPLQSLHTQIEFVFNAIAENVYPSNLHIDPLSLKGKKIKDQIIFEILNELDTYFESPLEEVNLNFVKNKVFHKGQALKNKTFALSKLFFNENNNLTDPENIEMWGQANLILTKGLPLREDGRCIAEVIKNKFIPHILEKFSQTTEEIHTVPIKNSKDPEIKFSIVDPSLNKESLQETIHTPKKLSKNPKRGTPAYKAKKRFLRSKIIKTTTENKIQIMQTSCLKFLGHENTNPEDITTKVRKTTEAIGKYLLKKESTPAVKIAVVKALIAIDEAYTNYAGNHRRQMMNPGRISRFVAFLPSNIEQTEGSFVPTSGKDNKTRKILKRYIELGRSLPDLGEATKKSVENIVTRSRHHIAWQVFKVIAQVGLNIISLGKAAVVSKIFHAGMGEIVKNLFIKPKFLAWFPTVMLGAVGLGVKTSLTKPSKEPGALKRLGGTIKSFFNGDSWSAWRKNFAMKFKKAPTFPKEPEGARPSKEPSAPPKPEQPPQHAGAPAGGAVSGSSDQRPSPDFSHPSSTTATPSPNQERPTLFVNTAPESPAPSDSPVASAAPSPTGSRTSSTHSASTHHSARTVVMRAPSRSDSGRTSSVDSSSASEPVTPLN